MKVQLSTMRDAFLMKLTALYSAEDQIISALPKMSAAATNPQLKTAFDNHLRETQLQRDRLDQCFTFLGEPPHGDPNPAIKGIITAGDMLIAAKPASSPDVIDACLIAAAQDVEHYEIAAYGTARAWAEQLGLSEIAGLLQQTLDEEGATDKLLTQLAEGYVNRMAADKSFAGSFDTTSGATMTGGAF